MDSYEREGLECRIRNLEATVEYFKQRLEIMKVQRDTYKSVVDHFSDLVMEQLLVRPMPVIIRERSVPVKL